MISARRADRYFLAAIYLAAVQLLVGPPIQTIRLLRYNAELPILIGLYALFPVLALLFVCSLLFGNRFRLLRPDLLEVMLIASTLWALVWTARYGGTAEDIGGNVVRAAFVFACYNTSRRYFRDAEFGAAIQALVAKYAVVGVGIALVPLYLLGVFGPRPVHVGLSSEGLLVAAAIAVVGIRTRDMASLAGLISLTLLSGKRATMFALAGMLLINWASYMRKPRLVWNRLVFVVAGLLAVVVAVAVIGYVKPDLRSALIPSSLQTRLSRTFEIGPEGFDWTRASAGRNREIASVLTIWSEQPSAMWTGMGYGASFTVNGIEKSNVHLSPLALMFVHGVPVGLALTLAIYVIPVQALFDRRRRRTAVDRVWTLTAMGYLAVSLTAMIIFQSPILWLALGAIRSRKYPPLSSETKGATNGQLANGQ